MTDGSRRNLQQGEPGKLEGSDGNLADAVPAQSQDLQGGAQVVQSAQLQRGDLVIVQVSKHKSSVTGAPAELEGGIDLSRHPQVFDPEACWKAVPSQFCDVVIAQIQSFQRRQLCDPTAVDSADLIVMSEEEKDEKVRLVFHLKAYCLHPQSVPITASESTDLNNTRVVFPPPLQPLRIPRLKPLWHKSRARGTKRTLRPIKRVLKQRGWRPLSTQSRNPHPGENTKSLWLMKHLDQIWPPSNVREQR